MILPSAVKETNSFICPWKRPGRSFRASRLDLIDNRLRHGLPIKFLHSRMKIIGHNRRWIQTGFQSVNQCFTNLFAHPRLFGLFKNSIELCNSTLLVIRAYPIQESLRPSGRRLQVVTFARKSIRKRILQFHIIIITVFTRHLACLDTLTRNFNGLVIHLMLDEISHNLVPIPKSGNMFKITLYCPLRLFRSFPRRPKGFDQIPRSRATIINRIIVIRYSVEFLFQATRHALPDLRLRIFARRRMLQCLKPFTDVESSFRIR